MKRHQPKHLYADNQVYFLTSHLYDQGFLLDSDSKRDKLLLKIFCFAWEYEIELIAWAVLIDHYHLLCRCSSGRNVSDYIGTVHRGFTFEVNNDEGKRGRQLWQNYWDRCARNEEDHWKHFNYIHNNPIKHGVVEEVSQLKRYRYSSYWNYAREKGEEWLMDAMNEYPILDFSVEND